MRLTMTNFARNNFVVIFCILCGSVGIIYWHLDLTFLVSAFGKPNLSRDNGKFNFLHYYYSNGIGKHSFYYYTSINQARPYRYVKKDNKFKNTNLTELIQKYFFKNMIFLSSTVRPDYLKPNWEENVFTLIQNVLRNSDNFCQGLS